MPLSSTTLGFSLMMIAAGIGIPIMAALNNGLGIRLGSPAAATVILFAVAMAVAALALAVTGLPPKPAGQIPPQYFFGGIFVAFYALSITYAAPRIGLGSAVMLVLVGQLFAAALIDHFGLLGAMRSPVTLQRAGGIALMVIGVILARRAV